MIQKLPELCNIQYGYAFDSAGFTEDSSYPPLVRIRDVKRGYSETYFEGEYSEEYVLHAGDLLVGMDGEFNIARWKSRDALLNQRVCKITAKEGTNEEYLRFALSKALKEIENRTAFVTVKHLSAKELNKLELQVPVLLEQSRIAEILSNIEQVISLRSMEIRRLDDLIKARFVEMFGDPFTGSSFEIKKLREISISIADGSNVDKAYYIDTGDVLFLRIQNVWFNEFRLDDSVFISDEVNRQYFDTSLHHGDLLITKIGRYYTSDSSLGRVSVYLGEDNRANYSNNIMRVRLADGVHSEFVNALMNLDDYNKYIRRVSVGGTDKRALSKAIIGDLPIIIPPYDLQMQFVDFVHQVDKSKVAVQKALDEAQVLFDSLMQQYFG